MYLYLIPIFVLATGLPQPPKVEIIHQEFKPVHRIDNVGQVYSYSFETSNGIYRDESGIFNSTIGLVVTGRYMHRYPDGTAADVSYTSDSNGFHIDVSVDSRIPSAALASLAG